MKAFIAAALAAGCLDLCDCSRTPVSGSIRIAIVPTTVFTMDPSLAWTSRGLPVVLYQDLSTSHKVAAVLVPNDSAAYAANATQILRTSIDSYHNRLIIKGALADIRTQRNLNDYNVETRPPESFIQSADSLAIKIAADAGPFSTRNDKALLAYAEAFTAKGQKQAQFLDEAARTDPAFGLAQNTLIEIVASQSPAQAQQLAQRIGSYRSQFTPLDRARFDLQMARISRVPIPQLAKQVRELLALSPTDISALMMLAQLDLAENKVSEAVNQLSEAIALDPGNVQARQMLAAAYLNSHQDDTATKTVEELRALRPDDVNVNRLVAEVEFSTGHLPEAEEAYKSLNDAQGIMGAAVCRLLAADTAGAQIYFERAAALRANDPLLPFGRAAWVALTGDRAKAVQMLTAARMPNPDFQSVALSQAAIYDVLNKNAAAAQQFADQSVTLAQSNMPKSFAIVASLIAHGREPAPEFETRLHNSSLDPKSQVPASAYAYFFAERYGESLVQWEMVLKANPGDLRSQVMRAATLNRMGRSAEAINASPRLLTPNLSGGDELAVPAFTELVRVRALADQHAGKTELARKFSKAIATYKW